MLTVDSVLCLPLGSTEQHGPHLPIGTDSVLASAFTDRLIHRYHATYDLWRLPTFEFGLSCEHAGAAGTTTLSVSSYCATLHALVAGLVEGMPSRNLAIVNGHGGNRGVLEALIYEFQRQYGMSVVVMHPTALSSVKSGSAWPEVHGGKSETSVMLELAPHLVDLTVLPNAPVDGDQVDVHWRVLDRGVTWPWNSGDDRIGGDGVIGDPSAASVDLGKAIIGSAVTNAERALNRLREDGRRMRAVQTTHRSTIDPN